MKSRRDIPPRAGELSQEFHPLDTPVARPRQGDRRSPEDSDPAEALRALSATVEELHAAEGQLREQNVSLIEAQAALEHERRRYRDLFDFAAEGLLATDPDGTILEANRAAAALLRTDQRHLAGKPLSAFVAAPNRAGFHGLLQRLQRVDRILGWALELRPCSGERVPVDVSAAAMREASAQPPGAPMLWWSVRDIRERKRAETELRERESRLRAILGTAVDGIVTIDDRGLIQSANAAAERMFGYEARELLGQNVRILMPSPHREAHDRYIARYLETGEARIIGTGREVRGQRKDGSTFPLELAVSTFEAQGRRMFTGMLRDLSERKALEKARHLYERMVEASNDLMAFVDPSYVYQAVNQRYAEVFGLPRDAIVGRTAADLVNPEHFETTIRPRLDECLGGRPVHYEYWLELPRWGRRCFDVRYDPYFAADGCVEGVLVDARDVTERKRLEDDAKRREAELAHAGRLATIGELAASVTHELKQPLSAIMTYARACSRLLDAGERDKLPQALDDIAEQARRAVRVTERLRHFSRRERIRRERLDINETVRETVRLVRHDLDRHHIALRYELAKRLPPVAGDKLELQQVLVNLVRNAVDAMNDDAGHERVVVIRTAAGADSVTVSVSDTGVGLPDDRPERVMESFFTTKAEGTGLGLSISRGIVEAHGGRLWAAPNPDRGASFHFTLPIGDHHDALDT